MQTKRGYEKLSDYLDISAFISFVTAVVVTGKVYPESITASVLELFPP